LNAIYCVSSNRTDAAESQEVTESTGSVCPAQKTHSKGIGGRTWDKVAATIERLVHRTPRTERRTDLADSGIPRQKERGGRMNTADLELTKTYVLLIRGETLLAGTKLEGLSDPQHAAHLQELQEVRERICSTP
jgi:hypothetical protein